MTAIARPMPLPPPVTNMFFLERIDIAKDDGKSISCIDMYRMRVLFVSSMMNTNCEEYYRVHMMERRKGGAWGVQNQG